MLISKQETHDTLREYAEAFQMSSAEDVTAYIDELPPHTFFFR